jgi:uncharacterized protein (DUF58 family)
MDWRVTARSGRAHTKLFEEERERGLLLLVDFNPGMRFGTRVRFKSVQAARAASLLAWLASANGDRVGICGFGGGITAEVKPARGRRGVLQVLRALRDWDHAAGEDSEALSSGLERARRLLRPGMRLILVSDGFSVDAQSSPALLRSAGRHELGAVLLSDQLEQHPPPGGRFALSLAGKRHVLDFGNLRMRTQWSQSFAERRLRLRSELQRIGARVVDLSTDSDLRRSLAPFTQRSVGPTGFTGMNADGPPTARHPPATGPLLVAARHPVGGCWRCSWSRWCCGQGGGCCEACAGDGGIAACWRSSTRR